MTNSCELRQNKYLNNIVEQDHRFVKRLDNPGLGLNSFYTARITISGYETMNVIRKSQVNRVSKGDIVGQVNLIADIFGVVG